MTLFTWRRIALTWLSAAALPACEGATLDLGDDTVVIAQPSAEPTDVATPTDVAEPVCDLGTLQCDGRLLQACISGADLAPAWVTLDACVSPELCVDDGSSAPHCLAPSPRFSDGHARRAVVDLPSAPVASTVASTIVGRGVARSAPRRDRQFRDRGEPRAGASARSALQR